MMKIKFKLNAIQIDKSKNKTNIFTLNKNK